MRYNETNQMNIKFSLELKINFHLADTQNHLTKMPFIIFISFISFLFLF